MIPRGDQHVVSVSTMIPRGDHHVMSVSNMIPRGDHHVMSVSNMIPRGDQHPPLYPIQPRQTNCVFIRFSHQLTLTWN